VRVASAAADNAAADNAAAAATFLFSPSAAAAATSKFTDPRVDKVLFQPLNHKKQKKSAPKGHQSYHRPKLCSLNIW
jgi:hypothetical protein